MKQGKLSMLSKPVIIQTKRFEKMHGKNIVLLLDEI